MLMPSVTGANSHLPPEAQEPSTFTPPEKPIPPPPPPPPPALDPTSLTYAAELTALNAVNCSGPRGRVFNNTTNRGIWIHGNLVEGGPHVYRYLWPGDNNTDDTDMCDVDSFTVWSPDWYLSGWTNPPGQQGPKIYHQWVRTIATPLGITNLCRNTAGSLDDQVYAGAEIVCIGWPW